MPLMLLLLLLLLLLLSLLLRPIQHFLRYAHIDWGWSAPRTAVLPWDTSDHK
jgi:hypothetical protein